MIWSWLQHHMSLQFIGQNPLSICVGFQNPTALCSRCPLQQLRPRAHVCILCSVGFELRVALEDEYGIALTSGSSLRYWRCQCPPTGSGSSHVFKSHSSRSCFLLVSHLLAKHFGSVCAIVLRCGLTLKIAVLIHMSPVLSMTLCLTSDNRMWTAIGDDGVQLRWRVDSIGDLPGSYWDGRNQAREKTLINAMQHVRGEPGFQPHPAPTFLQGVRPVQFSLCCSHGSSGRTWTEIAAAWRCVLWPKCQVKKVSLCVQWRTKPQRTAINFWSAHCCEFVRSLFLTGANRINCWNKSLDVSLKTWIFETEIPHSAS